MLLFKVGNLDSTLHGLLYIKEECQSQIKHYKNARFKKFINKKDAVLYFEKSINLIEGFDPREESSIQDLKNILMQYKENSESCKDTEVTLGKSFEESFADENTEVLHYSNNEEYDSVDSVNSVGILSKNMSEFLEENVTDSHEETCSGLSSLGKEKETRKIYAQKICEESLKVCGESIVNGYLEIYTDGACLNNGADNAAGAIGVYFGEESNLNMSAMLEGKVTNNIAELRAASLGLQKAYENGFTKVKLYTDSSYVVKCCTLWIKKWKKNNWRRANGDPVLNQEELALLDETISKMDDVKMIHVRGHNGIKGNEFADRLARYCALEFRKQNKDAD